MKAFHEAATIVNRLAEGSVSTFCLTGSDHLLNY